MMTPHRTRPYPERNGLTLVEVLLASVILALTASSILTAMVAGHDASVKVAKYQQAHMLASNLMEEIKRFRERKLVSLPSPLEEVGAQIASARGHFDSLGTLSADLSTPDNCRLALKELARTQRELSVLRRALKERMDAAETEALAATV